MQSLYRALVAAVLCLPLFLVAPLAAAADLGLLASVPSANQTGASRRNMTATLIFSSALNASTATPSTVSLVGPEGPEAITITVVADQLRVKPARWLGMLAHYKLRVTTGLRGASGETLPQPVEVPFTTTDGDWLGTESFAASIGGESEAQVVVDREGNAIMVWIRGGNVFAQQRVGGGWGGLRSLGNIGAASNLHLVGTPHRVAYAVWQEEQGFVQLMQFSPEPGWLGPFRVGVDDGRFAMNPRVAVNEAGDSIVVWEGRDVNTTSVFAQYRPFAGFPTRTFGLETSNKAATAPQVAFSGANAMAVWDQVNFANVHEVSWSRFDLVGWTAAQNTIGSTTAGVSTPQIVLSPNGEASATWFQKEGFTNLRAYGNHFSGGSWGAPFAIEAAVGNGSGMQLASDEAGNAIAVWSHLSGSKFDIHANRYVVGRGWDATPTSLELSDAPAGAAVVSFDKSGNALVIWSQRTDGTHRWPYFSRYTAGGSWSPAAQIFAPDAVSASQFSLGVNGTGQALVIWSQSPGQFILGSRME